MSGCPNCYDFGSVVQLSALFYADDGTTLADPNTVTLRIMDPNGIETTPTPLHVSTGTYQYNMTAMVPGVWYYRFEGIGAVTAVYDANFVVASTVFADAMSLLSLTVPTN